MDLQELYKKKDKLNMKVKTLGDKIVKINKQISKIEYENMMKAGNVILDGNFNLQVGK